MVTGWSMWTLRLCQLFSFWCCLSTSEVEGILLTDFPGAGGSVWAGLITVLASAATSLRCSCDCCSSWLLLPPLTLALVLDHHGAKFAFNLARDGAVVAIADPGVEFPEPFFFILASRSLGTVSRNWFTSGRGRTNGEWIAANPDRELATSERPVVYFSKNGCLVKSGTNQLEA